MAIKNFVDLGVREGGTGGIAHVAQEMERIIPIDGFLDDWLKACRGLASAGQDHALSFLNLRNDFFSMLPQINHGEVFITALAATEEFNLKFDKPSPLLGSL